MKPVQSFLYDLKKLLDPACRNLENSVIDPNSAAAFELVTRAKNMVDNELLKLEREENRLDAIPLVRPKANENVEEPVSPPVAE